LFLTVLLTIVQATPPVPRQAPDTSTQSSQAIQKNRKAKHKPANTNSSLLDTNTPKGDEDKSKEVKTENTEQTVGISKLPSVTITPTQRDWADWAYWLFNFFLVAVGGFQVYLVWRTLKAVQRQANSLEKQTKATEEAASAAVASSKSTTKGMDILVARERPRITVVLKDPDFSRTRDLGLLFVRFDVECWCPTVAYILDGRSQAYVSDIGALIPPTPQIELSLDIGLPNEIRQTTTIDKSRIVFDTVGRLTVADEIDSGKLILWCYGSIKYRGVHLAENDPPYETVFRYKWTPDATKGAIPGLDNSQWEKCPNPEHNYET